MHCLSEWCHTWAIRPNVNKCGVFPATLKLKPIILNYELSGSPLAKLKTVNDLGVTFDPKLIFLQHITKVHSKAMQMLGILYRFTDIRDPASL